MGARDWIRWLAETPNPQQQKAIMSAVPLLPSGPFASSPRWSLRNSSDWSLKHASQEGYEVSSIVRACVDKVATPLRSVPWRVSTLMEDEEEKRRFFWEMKRLLPGQRPDFINDCMDGKGWYSQKSHLQPLVEHPLEKLIMDPNPFFSGPQYIEMSAQHLLLGGNAIFHQVRNSERGGGRTIELWLIPPDEIEPEKNRDRWIKNYFLNDLGSSQRRRIPATDILHMMLPSPTDPFWGMSPLRSAAISVDTDIEAVGWNKVSFQNRAVTSGVFSFDKPMTHEKWEESRQQVSEQHMGSDNPYVPWVLGAGAKWQQMSMSPVEMDFIRSRSMTRDDVSLVLGIDPRIHGAGEQTASREAIKEIWRLHWLNLLLPFLDRYEEMYNKFLAAEYPNENLFVWYDTSNVEALREADIDKARVAKIYQSMGVPFDTINERFRIGFPPIPFGDVGLVPASAITVERAIEGQTQPGSGSDTSLDSSPDGGDNVTDNVVPPEDTPDQTGVTAEVGNEGMKNLPGSGTYSFISEAANGHTKTWTEDEVQEWLDEHSFDYVQDITDNGNTYEVWTEDDLFVRNVKSDYLPASVFLDEGTVGSVIHFYHGGRDLMLAEKRKDWGWQD